MVNSEERGRASVRRALAVLSCFSDGPAELRLTDIARSVGVAPSTAHRLIGDLVAAGFVVHDAAAERYRLGPAVLVLGQRAAAHSGFDRAGPVLEALAERTGESASLAVRSGRHALVVMLVPSKHPLRFDHGVGSTIPVHASAMGKALLAFAAGDALADVTAGGPLERFTGHTIVTARRLRSELVLIRDRGWAANNGERYDNVSGVAAPVLDGDGHAVAVVGVQGPTDRIQALGVDIVGAAVCDAAREI